MDYRYDLHTHTIYSDGSLSPKELVTEAHVAGVTHLAITDHDTVDGLEEARESANALGIKLILGTEISVTYHDQGLHILGLNIDKNATSLEEGLSKVKEIRSQRATQIANALSLLKLENPLEKVQKIAKTGIIGRRHFAELLVNEGFAKDIRSAFKHFLVAGKPGYVPIKWVSLEESVQWIREAGGIAAIAHPLRYKLSSKRLKKLFVEFKSLGGEAIEVSVPNINAQGLRFLETCCREYGFLATQGSDYHGGEGTWQALGKFSLLPQHCEPVWTRF